MSKEIETEETQETTTEENTEQQIEESTEVPEVVVPEPTIADKVASLSPIERGLLDWLIDRKEIPFYEIQTKDPRFIGTMGKLLSRKLAYKYKDHTKPKKERNSLRIEEEVLKVELPPPPTSDAKEEVVEAQVEESEE